MARVTITQQGMDRTKIVPPGKYPAECIEITEEESGKDGSTYWAYTFKIIDGQYKGVEPRAVNISEKAESMGYTMWESMGTQIKPGVVLDPLGYKGKRCIIVIQRGEYKGKPQNEIVDFAPLTGPAAEAVAVPKAT